MHLERGLWGRTCHGVSPTLFLTIVCSLVARLLVVLVNTDLCSAPLQLTDNSVSGLSASKFPVVDRAEGWQLGSVCLLCFWKHVEEWPFLERVPVSEGKGSGQSVKGPSYCLAMAHVMWAHFALIEGLLGLAEEGAHCPGVVTVHVSWFIHCGYHLSLLNQKDFLQGICLTPDCEGVISKIIIFSSGGQVKCEVSNKEKTS